MWIGKKEFFYFYLKTIIVFGDFFYLLFFLCIRFRNEKSRLVREDDDNDQSDEERLDFSSATNAMKIEKARRIEEFNAARDEGILKKRPIPTIGYLSM